MKRILIRAFIAYVCINALLAILFFSAGGLQMVLGPTIPEAAVPSSLSSDLKFFQKVVLANEKDTTPEQQREFKKIIDQAPSPQNVDDLTLTALQALAVFDNAHTTVLKTKMYRLPVRFHWTADGLIIVKARAKYKKLLGRKVLSIGGKSPESMLAHTAILTGSGTSSWIRYRSEFLFSAPSALSLIGADVEDNTVELHAQDPNGGKFKTKLSADKEIMPGDPFWDFLNAFPDDDSFKTEEWVSLLHRDQALPLYLQESTRLHLLRELPEYDAIYVRMNASFADKSESLEQFEKRILEAISQNEPGNIIVDFRFNRGGDYTKVLPIVRSLSNATPENGRLYLIVGPNTFSAGIIAGSQFKRFIPDRLTVVGSEIGDRLRFRAEGFYPTLPESGIKLYLTKGWTDLVDGCGWFDDCWPPNKLLLRKVGSLEVDIPIENTWDSYRTGNDLVIDSVYKDIVQRKGS
ncbi:hypothetical protein [Microbulbifer litoralis]|uniref:hypothetical protein n=1 Tax=Microbulbifer litoralis TaxID=2933965 RepID=UPI00202844FF|nr:hypothetical protein [Microbulbifer sp. GX H0434]